MKYIAAAGALICAILVPPSYALTEYVSVSNYGARCGAGDWTVWSDVQVTLDATTLPPQYGRTVDVVAGDNIELVYRHPTGDYDTAEPITQLGTLTSPITGRLEIQDLIDMIPRKNIVQTELRTICVQPNAYISSRIDLQVNGRLAGNVRKPEVQYPRAAEICSITHIGEHDHGTILASHGGQTSRRESKLGLMCREPVSAFVHVVGGGSSATTIPGVRLDLAIDGSLTGGVYTGVSDTIDITLASTVVISDSVSGGRLNEARIILVDIL